MAALHFKDMEELQRARAEWKASDDTGAPESISLDELDGKASPAVNVATPQPIITDEPRDSILQMSKTEWEEAETIMDELLASLPSPQQATPVTPTRAKVAAVDPLEELLRRNRVEAIASRERREYAQRVANARQIQEHNAYAARERSAWDQDQERRAEARHKSVDLVAAIVDTAKAHPILASVGAFAAINHFSGKSS